MESSLKIKGYTNIWIERKSGAIEQVCSKPNAVTIDFFSTVIDAMQNPVDYTLDPLFTLQGANPIDETQEGYGGIAIQEDPSDPMTLGLEFSMVTTRDIASGEKLIGEYVSDRDIIIGSAKFVGNYSSNFSLRKDYAFQDFANISLGNGDRLIIEWELFI